MSCVYSFDLVNVFYMQTTPKFNHAAKIYVIFISVGNPKSESNFLYPKKL